MLHEDELLQEPGERNVIDDATIAIPAADCRLGHYETSEYYSIYIMI